MAASKKTVTFNANEFAGRMIELDTLQESGKKELMTELVARFGEQACKEGERVGGKQVGGLSMAAWRDGGTPNRDTQQRAANAVGITWELANELATIVKALKVARAPMWQEYQRAYFGRKEAIKTAPVEKDYSKEQIEAKEAKAALLDIKERKEAATAKLKRAKAELAIAKLDGDKEVIKAKEDTVGDITARLGELKEDKEVLEEKEMLAKQKVTADIWYDRILSLKSDLEKANLPVLVAYEAENGLTPSDLTLTDLLEILAS
jgi:hypothetical protein